MNYMKSFSKKILILLVMTLILSCTACTEKEEVYDPILGEDVISNELIVDNVNYSYMRLELVKRSSYEKELCDSDHNGLYSEYYKVEVNIKQIYTNLNLPLCNSGNSMKEYQKEKLTEFNQNLTVNYYLDVPKNLISAVETIDEVIMRVYAPIAVEYILMPEAGNSLGYLSSSVIEENVIKHNFYPIIDGLVNVYTRTYEQTKYRKIYTNLDGFKYYNNGLKDRMTLDEFNNWVQDVYNAQKESELINKISYSDLVKFTKDFTEREQIGFEDEENYTDNEGLVVLFSKMKEHSAIDGVKYELYTLSCMDFDSVYLPASGYAAFALVNLIKKDRYDSVKVNENKYYVVEVEIAEIFECDDNYTVEYGIGNKDIKYQSLNEANNALTEKYHILIKTDSLMLINDMDSMIFRVSGYGIYDYDALQVLRILPDVGSSLTTIDLTSTSKYYDYYPVKDNQVSIFTRDYNDFSIDNISTNLDDCNQYFYRALKDRMSVEELKMYLSIVQKRALERINDHTNIWSRSF